MSKIILTLDQAAIEEALVEYIKKMGMNTEGATFDIDFTSTRNPTTYTANVAMSRESSVAYKNDKPMKSREVETTQKEVEEAEETKEEEKEEVVSKNEHATKFKNARALFKENSKD